MEVTSTNNVTTNTAEAYRGLNSIPFQTLLKYIVDLTQFPFNGDLMRQGQVHHEVIRSDYRFAEELLQGSTWVMR